MNITTYPTYAHADKGSLTGKTAVVIDVLRATSTITTALDNGCVKVIPEEEEDAARARAKALSAAHAVLLGGEVNGVKIPGFDLGNSPLEYGRRQVEGRTLVMCTTNGTHAIKRAEQAAEVYLGCLNNARAVALKAKKSGRDIAIICAGTRLAFSVDDAAAAGAIISRILKSGPARLDENGQEALEMYEQNKGDMHLLIEKSSPYKTLVKLGAKEDIAFCLREDVLQTVPVYTNGEIL